MAHTRNLYGESGRSTLRLQDSPNVLKAMYVAERKGIKTVALTGGNGGGIRELSDVCILAPEWETYKVQELHLPIYHCICAAVEGAFFEV